MAFNPKTKEQSYRRLAESESIVPIVLIHTCKLYKINDETISTQQSRFTLITPGQGMYISDQSRALFGQVMTTVR